MTLADMKDKLASLETQYFQAVEEYNIVGSHSVKYRIENIQTQISLLTKRILRFQGYTGRTTPDFSTGQGNNNNGLY